MIRMTGDRSGLSEEGVQHCWWVSGAPARGDRDGWASWWVDGLLMFLCVVSQQPGPALLSSTSSPQAAQGDGQLGPWSVHHTSSAAPSSSHSSPAPAWGPSHRLQLAPAWVLSMGYSPSGADCSNVGPSQGHSSCQEPAAAQAPHGVTARSGNPPALVWGPPLAVGGYLLPCGLPWLQGNLCYGAWSTSCPPSAMTAGSTEFFLSHSFLWLKLPLCRLFFPFSNSLRGATTIAEGSALAVVGLSWSWLALAPLHMGEASSSFSQKPPL